ncbi:YlqD family protein [Rossellomorea marisflavi]|uniref:Uncharacterized protein n=1 Tax=Rossellomorea marisflavi TaxID=189381 RepID=A0A0J5SHS1_9BACI|nr:YlqD family protein [Rossellomorea marisflavi]KMK96538.1 hypothetical protein VL03_02765 [Rossellomorea marisflavi]KML06422.1 hypothetical protein VL06_10015 [Rossellomorea marisflavi]KML32809.1 hypothetical protein VL12_13470 [Rossellomorea marisflavi]KZE49791.1 hypothetical protein AV649_01820 [Rossellomorea marisflavi]MCM2604637.1 YlqD family protein [Rossellomorea marisflavi]
MDIIHKVTVKQILTETSKGRLVTRYQEQAAQLAKECDQLRFEMKKIERAKKYPSEKLRQHFDKELDERAEKIKLLDFQLDQLDLLPLGSELKEKEVQGISRVQVGDNWNDEISRTIIIEDGIIKEIR